MKSIIKCYTAGLFFTRKMFVLLLMMPLIALGQSTNQNYVKSTVYKQETATSITNPTPEQATVNVTYFDGLGRPMQQVAHKQSGTGTDIVTPIVYDALGRQVREHLPVPVSTSSMLFTPNETIIADPTSYYTNNYGADGAYNYSEKRLEASPLNRLLEQGAPGYDWRVITNSDTDHTIKYGYQTNTGAEVRKFKANATPPTSITQPYGVVFSDLGYYPANQLYKNILTDENGIETHEFKNQQGQVVLKRNFSDYKDMEGNMLDPEASHDTYYVYDQYGNLSYVIPPLANGNATTALEGLCYQYKYDYRNRLVEKKLPGKQWEFIVYDKLDRVAATGPAFSPFNNFTAPNNMGWLVTKYDAFGRVVLTAWKQSSTVTAAGRASLQGTYNNSTILHETRSTGSTINGVSFNYTTVTEPVSGYHVLTANYYDTYANLSWVPSSLPTTSLGDPIYYNHTQKPKGLATASWVRVLESSALTKNERSYQLYDKKARPVLGYKQNHLLGYDTNYTKYDFIGQVLQSQTIHRLLGGSAPLTTTDTYTYTGQGRLLLHKHKINNLPEQLIVKNEYDALGQLKNKKVGGVDLTASTFYQKVDYSYNIRGWLKGINDISNLNQGSDPVDLFSFMLHYNETIGSIAEVDPLFNGNISETFWRTENDNVIRKYGYRYDQLNRLTDAIYQKPDAEDLSNNLISTNSYRESASYDKNGNIQHMLRNGAYDDATYDLTIDDLEYYYLPNTNQLLQVDDLTLSSEGFKDGIQEGEDYAYDVNGNMISDENKKIQNITYNHLNLPTFIYFENQDRIQYTYNAEGVKVDKMISTADNMGNTGYLNGFHYFNGVLQFFPTAEGYVKTTELPRGGGTAYNYAFNYTDHLGNVRLTYGFDTARQELVIMEENNYYPFGLKHNNYNWSRNDYQIFQEEQSNPEIWPILTPIWQSDAYDYKYNGKEYQDELGLNFYDFGWRDYDPAIGRFTKIDRFAEKYHKLTPYGYAGNNPVLVNDVQGDSLWISFGRNNENRALYQNGQLLNQDGSRYEGAGVKVKKDGSIKITNSFLNKTVGALNKVGSTKDGSGMIADVQSSTFSLTINDAKFNPRIAGRNEYKADNTINASFHQGQNQNQGTFTDIGSGGNVYWNPTDSTVGTVNEVGGTGFRPVTNLGHEIFHGLDGINGNLDNSLNSYGLPVKEMRASYYENSMRSDLGYPMRSTYNNISILDGQGAPIYQPPPSVFNMLAN